jgi:hypothetical protein
MMFETGLSSSKSFFVRASNPSALPAHVRRALGAPYERIDARARQISTPATDIIEQITVPCIVLSRRAEPLCRTRGDFNLHSSPKPQQRERQAKSNDRAASRIVRRREIDEPPRRAPCPSAVASTPRRACVVRPPQMSVWSIEVWSTGPGPSFGRSEARAAIQMGWRFRARRSNGETPSVAETRPKRHRRGP